MSDDVIDNDAQVVEESTQKPANGGEILINMESMIKNYMASIDKLSIEVKKHKEMLDDIFENSPTFKDHSEKAKEASKLLAGTKAQILRQPQAAELSDKLKNMKTELKENQEALSDYLQEYARMAGVNEIEGEDGEVREIVYSAKLVKKAFRP